MEHSFSRIIALTAMARMLEVMGHRVLLAESGQKALQTLAVNACDLVFTDLAMPEMDGWETTREIRKLWPEMNVVLVTGYGTGTVPPAGEDRLVNGIIGKPFDLKPLEQVLATLSVTVPEPGDKGEVTLMQEDVGSDQHTLDGGLSLQFQPE